MRLKSLLAKSKKELIQNWFDRVVETYPANSSNFLKSQNDPFANPVGNTMADGIEALFDALIEGKNAKAVAAILDPMIRIRAVQDFFPSQATAFILSLKKIIETHVRQSIPGESIDFQMVNELLEFEARIDQICLTAFDIYMECKQKVYQLKADNFKNRTLKAFQRAGLITETPEVEAEAF